MAGTVGAWSQVQSDGTLSQTSNTSSATKSSTKADKTTSSTIDMQDFLNLLVAEMQNQDPLEPTDNSQYMGQLATFSQVEATSEMNSNVLEQKATSLVGKIVIMKTTLSSDGYVGGVVDSWQKMDDTIYLKVNDVLYDIADLEQVLDDDYYTVVTPGQGDSSGNITESEDDSTDNV
ncbi:MAG: flagellar hook capping FlgD N-terminal domain-containing protein [Eubacteriales bacterium]|nr:flagellar hook capping FlgD N-terminal domain-containing protein [Eubacteriales bacterium]